MCVCRELNTLDDVVMANKPGAERERRGSRRNDKRTLAGIRQEIKEWNPTCKQFSRFSLAIHTRCSLLRSDWELSVMFEINIQMRIRFQSETFCGFFLSLSPRTTRPFSTSKAAHKMCLLFVEIFSPPLTARLWWGPFLNPKRRTST